MCRFTNVYVQFAYWTQRGYYPETPHKENQDCWSVDLQFAGEQMDAMVGVYDGHGTDGHTCARYAAHNLPQYLAKSIRQLRAQKGAVTATGPLLTETEFQECCKKSFLECNEAMHQDKKVCLVLNGGNDRSGNRQRLTIIIFIPGPTGR
jgi:serine/threonine protein phosphatase PrpC